RRCALLHHGSDPLDLPNTSTWRDAPRQLASAPQIVPRTLSGHSRLACDPTPSTERPGNSAVPKSALDINISIQVMAMTGERPASGELQVSLRPLQRLDRRLFVDTDDDGVLRRRDIEPNDIGGFGGEFGIVAFAPGFTPRKVDLLDAQKAPDLLLMHIAQGLGQQRSCPALRGLSLSLSFLSQQVAASGDTGAAILLALEALPKNTN